MSQEPDFMRDHSLEQPMPHSAEAENTLLGLVQKDNSLFPQAVEMVRPEDFYIPSNRRIYLAMCYLFEVGQEINAILIGEELKKENQLDRVGGISYILSLTSGLVPTSNVEPYCKIIREKSMLRQLIKEGLRIVAHAYEQEDPAPKILEAAGKGIFDITLENINKGMTKVGVLAHQRVQKAHEISQQGKAITGLSTGFSDLDALTLGLQRKDLIILCARPSMGKTAGAVSLASFAGLELGALVAFFSLEMSEDSITDRMLCSHARVDSLKFRNGFLVQEEWNKIGEAETSLQHAKVFIEDTAGLSALQIKAKCRRLVAEQQKKLDLVIVDYLGLMANSGSMNGRTREQEVSTISRDMKNMAKELDVPVLLLSQLSRKPEERADHRPQLADLRESGSLEQDADLVIGLYREDKYKQQNGDHLATFTHIAEWILLKQRNGPTGTVALRFDDPSGRFDNLYGEEGH